jgi:hypothetical protein
VRIGRFKGALLSTVIIASLITSIAVVTSALSASSVSASPDNYEIIIRGKVTAYSVNVSGDAPWIWYAQGDCPPIMAAKRIGSGAVTAAGTAFTCLGGITYSPQRWVRGEWDVLLDKAFQWMVTGSTKVLWYGDSTSSGPEYLYFDANCCSWLIADLEENFGYTVDNTIDGSYTEITPDLLASYDILVLPQLRISDSSTEGDPSLLPDNVVLSIKNFVEGGGGLLIMEMDDLGGWSYRKVQNRVLQALNMGVYFQSDEVCDNTNNWGNHNPWLPIADTDPVSEIGSAYQAATGKTDVSLIAVCSLAPPGFGISFLPPDQYGLQGWTLTYTVKVQNLSDNNNAFTLRVSDSENWGPWLEDNLLTVLAWENESTTLAVTIPSSSQFGTQDKILVTATSQENIERDFWCTAVAGIRLSPTDDSEVNQGHPSSNFGSTSMLYVGPENEPWLDARTFLKFDLSKIPPSIASAKLWLCCYTSEGSVPEDQRYLQVRGVDNDEWNEKTIIWNNQPSYRDNALDTCLVPQGTKQGIQNAKYSWDVTDYVREQKTLDNRVSLCLRAENEDLEYFCCEFNSKDCLSFPYLPYLEIELGLTPNGENVQVVSMPGTAITFASVENTGVTTWTTSTSGPSSSHAFEIVGLAGRGIYYDITTTATHSGQISLCIDYDETQVAGAENDLKLFHEVDNRWVDVTTYVDTENNKIYGTTSSLSRIIIVRSSVCNLNLVAGWNLVDFPFTSSSTTPDNLFVGQTYYIWRWSAENKKYVSPPADNSVQLGVGYWIWVGNGQAVTTSGIPVDTYSENLKNGWNLVGFPVTSPNTTPDNLFFGQTYYIWKWDAIHMKYVSPSSTAPVELDVGYWIWVDHDQTVTVPL